MTQLAQRRITLRMAALCSRALFVDWYLSLTTSSVSRSTATCKGRNLPVKRSLPCTSAGSATVLCFAIGMLRLNEQSIHHQGLVNNMHALACN